MMGSRIIGSSRSWRERSSALGYKSPLVVLLTGCLGLLSLACGGSPVEEDVEGVVIAEGDTVLFEGLEATITRFNTSWVPLPSEAFEGPPSPLTDQAFMTLRIDVKNRSDEPRSLSARDFALRASSLAFGTGEALESRVVSALPDGRTPRLADVTLTAGETIEGWVTYVVPRRIEFALVLWSPRSDVTLGIEVPSSSRGRIEAALVFGRVTDQAGDPRPQTVLQITPVDVTIPPSSGGDAVVGECRGALASARQAVTDQAGWYQDTISTVSGDEFCVDVRVASDDGGATRSSATVRPASIGNPFIEIPRFRIDLTLE